MKKVTEAFMQQQEALYARRKQEILNAEDQIEITGTTYYVSAEGDDANDGKSPLTPWKTLKHVSESRLQPGDGVRFCRGDLFRGNIFAGEKPGVTYAAYGTGPKPEFRGWDENLADPALWEEVDATHHIWKYVKPVLDPGTLVFNEGETVSRKLIPSYRDMRFVCRDDESRPFIMAAEMTRDLDLFWHYEAQFTTTPSKGEDFPIPIAGLDCYGELYLRCDRGNPGAVFSSVEIISRRVAIRVATAANVRVDNLCMKYFCFGVSCGNIEGLRVTNCEIGWIGGNIQTYLGTDPNYPEGRRGSVTRFGNGIEIYGNSKDCVVDNCYIYQVYDAGATHQVNAPEKRVMTNLCYSNNLIEACVYGIEYFLDEMGMDVGSYMDGIEIRDNLIVRSGYGWGQQRHNYWTPAAIKGWSYINTARNFTIHNNTFDRCSSRLLHLVALEEESCPEMYENVYIQHMNGSLGQYGGNKVMEPGNLVYDENAEQTVAEVFRDRDAQVWTIG